MKLYNYIIAVAAFLITAVSVSAQQKPLTPEEREKQLYESIDTEIEKLERSLKLEDWQVFMVDSIYTHDYMAMVAELQDLQNKKIENQDIYYNVQDKWMEAMYQAFSKVLDEEQWSKYLKSGASRSKKARDKRAASVEKSSAKIKK